MRTVSMRLADLSKTQIRIGYEGENLHTTVLIDCKKVFDEYPGAAASLTVQPPAGAAYPAVVTRDGDIVEWEITDSDLIHEGEGEIQLAFTVGEVVVKTAIGSIRILRSIMAAGEIPDPLDDFLTRAGAALTAIPETIDAALEEAKESGEFDGYSPTVDVTTIAGGHRVSVTDAEGTETFDVMDGVDGRDGQDGRDGIDGKDGKDGADGADGYSPTVDVTEITGGHRVSVTDAEGTETFDVMDGEDGEQGEQGETGATPVISIGTVSTLTPGSSATATMDTTDPEHPVLSMGIPEGQPGNATIDDTAGDGDTTKVWSADKNVKELNKKAPIIQETIDTPAAVQTFTDGADRVPMELTVKIEPVQDLHGYDSPWVGGANKNLFDSDTELANVDGTIRYKTLTLKPNTNYTCSTTLPRQGGNTANLFFMLPSASASTNTNGVSETVTRTVTSGDDGKVKVGYRLPSDGTTVSQYLAYHYQIEEGSSATSWVPYKNICPISGWDKAEIVRTKNLLDENVISLTSGAYISVSDGSVNSASEYFYTNEYIPVNAGENYTFAISKIASTGNRGAYAIFYDASKEFIPNESVTFGTNDKLAQNILVTFETPNDASYVRFDFPPYTAGTQKFVKGNNVDGIVDNEGNVYSITFPSSAGVVYGDTLTVNQDGTGSLVVDRAGLSVADVGTINSYGSGNSKYYYFTVTGIKRASSSSEVSDKLISNLYTAISGSSATGSADVKGIAISSNSDTMIIKNVDVADSTELKAQGIFVVYPLATAVSYTLTAEQVGKILSLNGVNNIWCDTGYVLNIKYSADTKMYIDNLFATIIPAEGENF